MVMAGAAVAANDQEPAQKKSGDNLWGRISIDGSSTVYPITDAAAREFKKVQPRVWVRVDLSASGKGIEKLLANQVQIADSSRPMNETEIKKAEAAGLSFIELPVALDGIAVVVHSSNTWVDSLSVEELKRIYEPESKVHLWSDLRPEWPAQEIAPCAPPHDSGTFDYFTTAICGKSGAIRSDYLRYVAPTQGVYVTEHPDSLGFFGFYWYVKYRDKLKLVPIRRGDGPAIAPNEETIWKGTYSPLSRALFIYVNAAAADYPEVDAFVHFYLQNAAALARQASYIPLSEDAYRSLLRRFEERRTGSAVRGKSEVGLSMDDLLK
jgi:phosphate transport system substrate-binding protein